MINTNPIFNIIKNGVKTELTPNSVSVTLQFGNADVSNEANTSSSNRDIKTVMVSAVKGESEIFEGLSQGDTIKIEFSEGNNLHSVESKVTYKGIEEQGDNTLTVIKFEPLSGAIDELTLKNGGGSGGTSDYIDLTNKPQINSHTLEGNLTSEALGLVDYDVYSAEITTKANVDLSNANVGSEYNGYTLQVNRTGDIVCNQIPVDYVSSMGAKFWMGRNRDMCMQYTWNPQDNQLNVFPNKANTRINLTAQNGLYIGDKKVLVEGDVPSGQGQAIKVDNDTTKLLVGNGEEDYIQYKFNMDDHYTVMSLPYTQALIYEGTFFIRKPGQVGEGTDPLAEIERVRGNLQNEIVWLQGIVEDLQQRVEDLEKKVGQ